MSGSALRGKTQNLWQSPNIRHWRHMFSVNRVYRLLTAEKRHWPDFIVAGAQKSGTTSLYRYLAAHPDMVPPITKKLTFFDNNFHRGTQWYRSHFPLRSPRASADGPVDKRFTGESTAYYMFHPLAPQRIAETLPETKFILLLRNPVDRAYSHYQYKVRRGKEPLSFEAAIDAEPERLAGEEEKICTIPGYRSRAYFLHSYLARGIYIDQILRWQKFVPSDRTLIVDSTNLLKRPAETYQQVLAFLGVRSWQPKDFGQHFAGGYKAKMSPEMRLRLIDYFAPHNQRLYDHLGQRFDWDR
jgi:hypothetical protein